MNSWLTKIDALQTRGLLLHGWGTLQGSGAPPTKAWLESRRNDGDGIGQIPLIFGKHHYGSNEGSNSIEFVIYGTLQTRPDAQNAFFLVIEWPDNRQLHFSVQVPRDITPGRGMARITALPWKHYVTRGFRLVRQGRLRLLINKLVSMSLAFLSSGWNPEHFLKLLEADGKPLALVIDHDLGGGANLYRRFLMERLVAEGFTPILLSAQHGVLAYQLAGARSGKTFTAHVEGLDALFDALSSADFKRVIFNNMVSFPEPLALVKKLAAWLQKRHIQEFLFLMHDHYCICPSWQLLNDEGKYCRIPDTSVCANCLPKNVTPFLEFSYGIDIISWRKGWEELLKEASEIRCFSNATKNLLLRAYREVDPRSVSVVPHTLEHVQLRKITLEDSGRPVIGIVGEISRHKGSQVVRELAEYAQAIGKNVHIVVVGTIDCELPRGVTITGTYTQKQLPMLLEVHRINVGLFPSIWPETFSYVTEEMIKMGLPLLAFDLGAPGERVAQYAYGRVIPLGSPQATLEAIERLYFDHVHELQVRKP